VTDTKRLRELAEAAIASPQDGTAKDWRVHYEYDRAANPEAVLGLIARIERLEAALRFYDAGPNCPQSNVAREALREET